VTRRHHHRRPHGLGVPETDADGEVLLEGVVAAEAVGDAVGLDVATLVADGDALALAVAEGLDEAVGGGAGRALLVSPG
jgi:hypothetical protein